MSSEKTFTCFALTECFENKYFTPNGVKMPKEHYAQHKGKGKIAFRVGNSISGRFSSMNNDKQKYHDWLIPLASTPTEKYVSNDGKVSFQPIAMTEKEICQWIIDNADNTDSGINPLWYGEVGMKAINDVLGGTKQFSAGTTRVKTPSVTQEQLDLLNAMLAKGLTPEQIATMTI